MAALHLVVKRLNCRLNGIKRESERVRDDCILTIPCHVVNFMVFVFFHNLNVESFTTFDTKATKHILSSSHKYQHLFLNTPEAMRRLSVIFLGSFLSHTAAK